MEDQQYCTAAFLDVSQAFDKVWHPGLLFKIKRILPSSYFNLLKSYLNERQFETKIKEETSSRFQIHSGVANGAFLVFFSMCYTHLANQYSEKLH